MTNLLVALSLPPVLTLLLVLSLTHSLYVGLQLQLDLVPALLAVLGVTHGVGHQVALSHARVDTDHVNLRGAELVILSVTLLRLNLFVVCVPGCGIF